MPSPIVYFAVTNHGFGHATRAASIAAEIKRRNPDITLIFVTTAPRWLLDSYLDVDYIVRSRALDIGVLQADSLQMDKAATLVKLQELRANYQTIVRSEVGFITQNRVGLVLGDIPPLAALIAKAANVPCWMMSNFGWDFIYRAWGGEFIEMADWIGDCFSQCDRLFRFPLHEPMSAFPNITDVGFTGGSPRWSPTEIRQRLGMTTPRDRTILMTFGGLGLDRIPYENLNRFPEWQFLTFDRQAPELPNLIQIRDSAIRPVDLMPICGRVLSKPGYSTFSEACRMETPIVSMTRTDFAEGPILVQGIQDYLPHQILQPEEFFNGNWDFLQQPLQMPKSPQPIPKDGNAAIAQAVVDFFANY